MASAALSPAKGTEDPTRVFIRQVLGAVAQLDRSLIVRKLRAARDRMKAKNGRCEGVKPFGTLTGEAETLQHIFDLQTAQQTPDKIAMILNAQRFPTRSGVPWRGSVVRKILARQENRSLVDSTTVTH